MLDKPNKFVSNGQFFEMENLKKKTFKNDSINSTPE